MATSSSSPVNTGKVADRRVLRFESIDQVLAEVDRLAAAERAGRLRRLGDWTLGQALGLAQNAPAEKNLTAQVQKQPMVQMPSLAPLVQKVLPAVVRTSYQCLRTYVSPPPKGHGPVSRQARRTVATWIVSPRQVNWRGSPGSPAAMRAASHVSVAGVRTSPTNWSGMVVVPSGGSD